MRQIEAHLDLRLVLRVLHGVIERTEAVFREPERFLRFLTFLCWGTSVQWSVVGRPVFRLVVLRPRFIVSNIMILAATYFAHVLEVIVGDGHIVQVLDVAQDLALHPSRLLSQKLQARIRVNC